jgi:hypothetical protein
MKKNIIVILSIIALLLCISACEREYKNKGRFEKNIPACIKELIKGQGWVIRAEEYCSKDDTKKIYLFLDHPQSTVCLIGYNENCNYFLVKSDEYDCNTLNPDCWVWGEMLPDGTIEYKEDIYRFNRVVFTQK